MRRTHNLSYVQVRLKFAGGLKYFENMAASGVGRKFVEHNALLMQVIS